MMDKNCGALDAFCLALDLAAKKRHKQRHESECSALRDGRASATFFRTF